MPPKRPPPLPKSLFVPGGPLSPGSAPPPPEPSSIHPEYIVDAHSFVSHSAPVHSPDAIFQGLPSSSPRPPVRHAVQVKMDVSAGPASSVLGVKPFSIHPTVLNMTLSNPPSITNIAKGAVDLIVPAVAPLRTEEWDLLDEAVRDLEGSWPTTSPTLGSMTGGNGNAAAEQVGKIVIAGILPPPLTVPSSMLARDEVYATHLDRMARLSLQANVYLKLLPPVVDLSRGQNDDGKWWTDHKEVERVLKMYLSPAIEAFGTHRIIWGSFPAFPISELVTHQLDKHELEQPISNDEWYAFARKVISELGEGKDAMGDVMGRNAAEVYGLAESPTIQLPSSE